MILLWKSEIDPGPYCRQCGIAAFRSTTNHCLLAGWWGVFAFYGNLYAIARNLMNRRKVRKIYPTPGSDPDREGPPLSRRPGIYVATAFVALLCFLVFTGITTSRSDLYDGKCVRLETERIREVSCSANPDAKVSDVVETDGDEFCPPETDEVWVLEVDEEFALCLDFDQ